MAKSMGAQSINFGMSTVISNRAYGKHAKQALRTAQGEVQRLEVLLSRFIKESEISRINRAAGLQYEKVSSDTFEILQYATACASYCHGLFDITIGPLVTLWNDRKTALKPPEEQRLRQTIPLVNYTDLLLDQDKKTAFLQKVGQSIDLGGIGKGFVGDKLIKMFKEYEVTSAFINIGGNVVTLGTKQDGTPWNVGIQHPRKESCLLGLVSVDDKSVVTSGDYQRYFIGSNGKRYHHILDPTTGYQAESGLVSVTIVADSSTAADALSTILFVAGMKKGLKLLRGFSGAEAILVDTNLQVYITAGLKGCFQANEDIPVNILKG